MHVKTAKEVEETSTRKGKIIVLECDKKSKEERSKYLEKHKKERIGVKGHIGIRFRNILCKKNK